MHMSKGLYIGLCVSLFAVGLVVGGLLACLVFKFQRRKHERSKFLLLVKPFHKTSVFSLQLYMGKIKNPHDKLIIVVPRKHNEGEKVVCQW